MSFPKQHINFQEMNCPGFIRVILLELYNKKMKLPLDFTKCIQDQLPERALLTDKHENLWEVKVGKASDNVYFFHDGWSTFMKDNSVKDYESLVFEYFGRGFFGVKLFDSFGCEKKLEFKTSIFKGIELKENRADKAKHKEKEERPKEVIGEESVKVEEADDEDDENEQNEEYKEEVSSDEEEVEREGEDDDDEEEIEAGDMRHSRTEVPRGSDGEGENSGMNDCARRRSKRVQVKQGIMRAEGHKMSTNDIGTSAANEKQRGKKRTIDSDEDVDCERTHRRKRMTMSYAERLFSSGLAVRPHNPFFMSRITGRKNELYVPLNFVRTGGVNLEEVTYLIDPEGNRFDLKCTPWTDGRILYTGAWRRFCKNNLVKEGDVCICEFVQGSNGPYMKVTLTPLMRE